MERLVPSDQCIQPEQFREIVKEITTTSPAYPERGRLIGDDEYQSLLSGSSETSETRVSALSDTGEARLELSLLIAV